MVFAFAIAIVIFIVALNIGATYRVHKDDYLNALQRKALTAFVWIAPIFGALFIYHFRGDDDTLAPEPVGDGLSVDEVVDPWVFEGSNHSSVEHGHDHTP